MPGRAALPLLIAALVLSGAAPNPEREVVRIGSEDGESFAEIIVDPVEPPAKVEAAPPQPEKPPEGTRMLLGTTVSLRLEEGLEPARAARAYEVAFAPFEWAAANLSSADTSPVTSINRRASVHAVVLPAEVCPPLREALALAERTEGAWDPALDPALCGRSGYRNVEIRSVPFAVAHPPCTARFAEAGMRLKLEGFARAWAIDRAVEALRDEGFTRFLLQAGGVGFAAGRWELPLPDGAPRPTLSVSDRGFAHAPEEGSPIHDARTCQPIPSDRKALVLANRATEALGLSRSAVAWTTKNALRWFGWQEGASAVIASAEDGLSSTPDLAPALAPPPPVDAGVRFP